MSLEADAFAPFAFCTLGAFPGSSSTTQRAAFCCPYQVSVADIEPDVEHPTIIRLYYPCDDDAQPVEAHWLPSWRYAQGYGEYMKLPAALAVPAFSMVAGWERKPCASDRPLAVAQGGWVGNANPLADGSTRQQQAEGTAVPAGCPEPSFPVVIFSHGLSGMRTTYSAMCTDFASHGYVVAAVEHRDGSACITWKGTEKVQPPFHFPFLLPSACILLSPLAAFKLYPLGRRFGAAQVAKRRVFDIVGVTAPEKLRSSR